MQMQLEVLLMRLASKSKTMLKKHGPKNSELSGNQQISITRQKPKSQNKEQSKVKTRMVTHKDHSLANSVRYTLSITSQHGCGNGVLIYCVVVMVVCSAVCDQKAGDCECDKVVDVWEVQSMMAMFVCVFWETEFLVDSNGLDLTPISFSPRGRVAFRTFLHVIS